MNTITTIFQAYNDSQKCVGIVFSFRIVNHRVSDIGVVCAHLTCTCPALTAEWLGVLRMIVCGPSASSQPTAYSDLSEKALVIASDPVVSFIAWLFNARRLQHRDNIAHFCAQLVAYGCVSVNNLLLQVVMPAILAPVSAANAGQPRDAQMEKRARFGLAITSAVLQSQSPDDDTYGRRLFCERYLLQLEHKTTPIRKLAHFMFVVTCLGDRCTFTIALLPNSR